MPASRPSFSNEQRPRRLGTGGTPGGGTRLLRTQLAIAFILGTTILAVLLYMMRRPSAVDHDSHDAPAEPSASAAPAPVIVRTPVAPKEKPPVLRVKIGAVQHVKCGASPKLFAASATIVFDSRPAGSEGSDFSSLRIFSNRLISIRRNSGLNTSGPESAEWNERALFRKYRLKRRWHPCIRIRSR